MQLRRRIITRLLLLDQPVIQRTDADLESEARENYRWNFSVSVLDGITFWFGLAFVSSATIVPLFVSKVTLNPLVIGLVAMLHQVGWHLPQLLSASAIERNPRKKPIVVNLGFFLERLPVLLWPLSAILCLWSPLAGLILFVLAFAWHAFGAGFVAPAWQDLLARVIPLARRGKMYGITTFLGTGTAAGGALISGYLLERYEYPYDFFWIFMIAAAGILLSWAFLALTREPVGALPERSKAEDSLWIRTRDIIRTDVNFRRFLIVRMLATLGTMGVGFITVSAVEILDIADSTVGFYTVILLIGQTLGGLLSGIIADRVGHKRSLALGGVATACGFAVIVLFPTPIAYFAGFGLTGFAAGVHIVSGLLVALEFAPPQRRPTYVGITNSVLGIAYVSAPLLGGWLALAGYNVTFMASIFVSVVSLILLIYWVREPRNFPAAHFIHSAHSE